MFNQTLIVCLPIKLSLVKQTPFSFSFSPIVYRYGRGANTLHAVPVHDTALVGLESVERTEEVMVCVEEVVLHVDGMAVHGSMWGTGGFM